MRPALFLAIALLATPATLAAQQRDPSAKQAPAPAPTDAAPATGAGAPEPERRSLMGMVMGALIASAEQAATDQSSQRRALDEAKPGAEDKPDGELVHGTRNEVALHSDAQGTP